MNTSMIDDLREAKCPTCGKSMRFYVFKEDSPFGNQIVEYGNVCDPCKTETFWSYGTNFYRWAGEEITQKEWSRRYSKSVYTGRK
jgi:hypothetical protein